MNVVDAKVDRRVYYLFQALVDRKRKSAQRKPARTSGEYGMGGWGGGGGGGRGEGRMSIAVVECGSEARPRHPGGAGRREEGSVR